MQIISVILASIALVSAATVSTSTKCKNGTPSVCDGQGFKMCSNGKWVNFACGTGTTCVNVGKSFTCGQIPVKKVCENGEMQCAKSPKGASGFTICSNNKLEFFACGAGTKCNKIGNAPLTCGF